MADAWSIGLWRLALAGGGRCRRAHGELRWRSRSRTAVGGLARTGPGRLRPASLARPLLRLRRRSRAKLGLDHGGSAVWAVVRGCDRPRRSATEGPRRDRPTDHP